jgi:hypothetical protein
MNRVSKTNQIRFMVSQQLKWLEESAPEAKETAIAAYVLLFEKLLLAVVDEVTEHSAVSDLRLSFDQQIQEAAITHGSIREIQVGLQQPGHWLQQWRLSRQNLFESAIVRAKADPTMQRIDATLIESSHITQYRQWLDAFTEFLDRTRELNNQY